MANDKKIDKLLASNATAKARFLTEKKKAIESTRALKNAEISMLTMARDKDFDKMLEIMNAQISMLTAANDKGQHSLLSLEIQIKQHQNIYQVLAG
jgi:hypothetical protein